jgi:glycosyltransferase involved in cell wall biosynthesis
MLNNEFPPLGGGTGTVNQALLQRFKAVDDLEVDLITSALGRKREEERLGPRVRLIKVPVNNANIHHSSARELLTYAWLGLREARRMHLAQPYDLCFAWSTVPAGWIAWRINKAARLPYLVRVGGPDIPGFERRYAALYPFLTPVIRAVWRRAAVVIAKCKGEAAMIRACDPGARIELIPNGVDLATFSAKGVAAEYGPLRLLCVGRLIGRKGQPCLFRAVQQVAAAGLDVRLELVGTGDAEQDYRGQVAALGLTERVAFAGYVPREEIPARYAAAHVFVLPSENEGMSVSTLEAMAAGLPVVVTRTGGTEELVEEGVNGLIFESGDTEALAKHLMHLAGDRALVRTMGQAARATAGRFRWETAAQRYLQVFKELV